MEIGFTLDNPPGAVAFSAGSATGTVNPFNGFLDANSIVCLDGSCDLLNQDWIVFTISVTSGSVNDLAIAALFEFSEGLGYFLQGGPVQDGTGTTDTYSGDSTSNPSVAVFNFKGNAGGGLAGVSLPLLTTYANGTLPTTPPGMLGEGATQFTVTEFGGAGLGTATVNATVTQHIDIIPEPHPAVLLFGGLMLLESRARRFRRS